MVKTSIRFIIRHSGKLILSLFLFFNSCDYQKEGEKNGLVIERADFAKQNQKYLIKIYFKDKKTKIYRAYFDCEGEKKINNDTRRIEGCNKQLKVSDDTIKIAFVPIEVGEKKFEDITVLFQDFQGELNLLDTTFYYNVIN